MAAPAVGGGVGAVILLALLGAGVVYSVWRKRRLRADIPCGRPGATNEPAAPGQSPALQAPHLRLDLAVCPLQPT